MMNSQRRAMINKKKCKYQRARMNEKGRARMNKEGRARKNRKIRARMNDTRK